jgi:hypothetical protein
MLGKTSIRLELSDGNFSVFDLYIGALIHFQRKLLNSEAQNNQVTVYATAILRYT